MTFFFPGTVLRSSGEWPCTSALGLFTRRYSAGNAKRSPPSNATLSVFLSLERRSSEGHGLSLTTFNPFQDRPYQIEYFAAAAGHQGVPEGRHPGPYGLRTRRNHQACSAGRSV